jgi:hypothetical protein
MDAENGVIEFGTGGTYTGSPSRTVDSIFMYGIPGGGDEIDFGGLFTTAVNAGETVSIPTNGNITITTGFTVASTNGEAGVIVFVR